MVKQTVGAAAGTALLALGLMGVAPASAASGFTVSRIAGATRDATAVAASVDVFPTAGSAKVVVLASNATFADALSGAPLAAAKGGPLLLTTPTSLDPLVETEILRVLPAGGTIDILGGTAAVDPSVDAIFTAKGFVVQRIAGANRFATAVAVAAALGNPSKVLEATGLDFADGLSAGAAAYHAGGAVLLTNGAFEPPETAAYLGSHAGPHYAVGGPAQQADPGATPIVGSDRYATAVDVASTFWAAPNNQNAYVGLASGAAFADALSGSANIASHGGPLLLVPPSGPLPTSVASYLSALPAVTANGLLYGGPAAVGDDVSAEIWGEPAAAGRCHTSGLSVTTGPGNSSAGHPTTLLVLTNTSATICSVSGYVGLQMLDSSLHPITTTVVPNGGMLSLLPLATVVTLAPGQQASTLVQWTDVPMPGPACTTSAQLGVTPPDETAALTVAAAISSCGGELDVSALQPGATAP